MSLPHAILAALSRQAHTGYELAKNFDESLGNFWNASHQQIYRELARMESLHWITHELITQVGKPSKKLYSLTSGGLLELQNWISHPSKVPTLKETLLIKLYGGYC